MHQELMASLDKEIKAYINHYFPTEFEVLITIPGVSEYCVATVLAEIGPNVEVFQIDRHLASWAGLCPGSYESAGIKDLHI